MSTFLSILTLLTSQIIFVFFGFYLQGMQMFLWEFQSYFESQRPNPVCQLYHTYAFPSIEGYYVAALVTFIILYGYYWDYAHSWMVWLVLYFVAFIPPLLLVWFSYNRWWELVFSMLAGIGFTLVFVITLKLYITPILPYLMNSKLSWWLNYQDTYLMCEKDRKSFKKCRAILKKYNEL